MTTLCRPTIDGEMYGVLATLQAGRGSQLMPVAAPIALSPLKPNTSPPLGRIARGASHYDTYRLLLDRVTAEGFAVLL